VTADWTICAGGISAAWMSSGTSSQTGPGRPAWQILHASSSEGATSSTDMSVFANFVIGRTESTMLYSWSPSWRSLRCGAAVIIVERLTCSEMTIIGTESSHAPRTPVSAFVPPGPVVTQTTPGVPPARAYPSAAIAQACSCRQQT